MIAHKTSGDRYLTVPYLTRSSSVERLRLVGMFTVGSRAEADLDSTGVWQNVTITEARDGAYSVVSDMGVFVGDVTAVQVRAQQGVVADDDQDDGVLGTISQALGVIDGGCSIQAGAGRSFGAASVQGGDGDCEGEGDSSASAIFDAVPSRASAKKKKTKRPKKVKLAMVEDSNDEVVVHAVTPLGIDPRMRSTAFPSDTPPTFDAVAAQQHRQEQPRGIGNTNDPSYGTVSMDDFGDIDPGMKPKDLCGDVGCAVS